MTVRNRIRAFGATLAATAIRFLKDDTTRDIAESVRRIVRAVRMARGGGR